MVPQGKYCRWNSERKEFLMFVPLAPHSGSSVDFHGRLTHSGLERSPRRTEVCRTAWIAQSRLVQKFEYVQL